VTALQRDGKTLAGAVVTVEAESPAMPATPPAKATMDQVDLAFVPDVLVVPVHSTVQFPNSDAVSHQVYSFSSARRFQLPLYRGKPYPPVTFDQPGIVTLGCNIHDNMPPTSWSPARTTSDARMPAASGRRRICPRENSGCGSGIRCSMSPSKSNGSSRAATTTRSRFVFPEIYDPHP
jgi:plastocyanin